MRRAESRRPVHAVFGGQGMPAAMLQALSCLDDQARSLADGESVVQKVAMISF